MKSTWKILVTMIVLYLAALVAIRPSAEAATSGNQRQPSDHGLTSGQTGTSEQSDVPFVSEPVNPTLSIAVRDLPEAQPNAVLEREINPRQNPLRDHFVANIVAPADPLIPYARLDNTTTAPPLFTFDGTDNFCGCSPPDTVGDVGPNHYVQMVNATVFNVYNKTGTVLVANRDLKALWSSGGCSTSDSGDPVVTYDSMADRWLLAQFRANFDNGFCVAVSQTPDPTGSYYLYEFVTPDFPDYFKITAWPDAYYVGSNETNYTAYALNRANMLLGLSANFIRLVPSQGANFLMPADVDGATPPPNGTPGIFYTFKDDTTHGGTDRVEIYNFNADWVTPGNSTFTTLGTFNITPFTYTVCGFFNLDCIPQGGTTQKVDPVSEWPMWRFVYRNFTDHQTLLGNFTVDVGSDRAGIRWFELRKTSGAWSLFQQGTYSFADTIYRWMGSIAMDGDGNIALGYSRSSSSLKPSIYYTTRLASDTPGTFGPEELMFTGNGVQTGSNRWGDYSSLNIDPADDCTFWYTQEYYPSNSGNNWNTRVGVFKIPSCGAVSTDLSLVKSDSVDPATLGTAFVYTLDIANSGPMSATNVIVTDTLPAGLSYVSDDSGCTTAGSDVICALGTMLNGDTAQINITVLPTAVGSVTNTAVVASDVNDTNPANNTDSETTLIQVVTDLAITKDAPAGTILVGDNLVYTLTVDNLGPLAADNVTVVDALPAQVTYVSDDAGCGQSLGTVTCNLGTITSGGSDIVHLTVMANTAATFANTANVSGDVVDSNPGNNSDSATITVEAPAMADLGITKEAPITATVGSTLVYTLTVVNNGPDDANSVVVTDTLPLSMTYVSDDSGCANNSGVVTCALGTVTNGQSVVIEITAMASAEGTAVNTATVTSALIDDVPANNTATATTLVITSGASLADVAISKTAPLTANVGENITYTLVITNNGPFTATGVMVTDTLPISVTYVSNDSGCVNSSGVVSCDLGDLVSGASVTIQIVVMVDSAGTLTNVAIVDSQTLDPIPSNNSASATTTAVEVQTYMIYLPIALKQP